MLICPQPPYPPQGAGVGGLPTVSEDVPPLSVFIFLYLVSFATNMTLFRMNLSKGHKFLPSALLAGFSMARVLTCTLRIVWATKHHNVSLAIAAQIFVNAGILIVYIINLSLAQRILRARQPTVGWNRVLRILFRISYVLIGVALILVIVLTVMSFYTLDKPTISDATWIRKGAITYLLVVAASPLALVPLAFLLPHHPDAETFGQGSMRSQVIILMIGSCLCTLIAGFRAGTTWEPSRPSSDPAWYDSKACFYVFNFTCEIIILCTYTISRIDKRFHVPDGSSKRKSYAIEPTKEGNNDTSSV